MVYVAFLRGINVGGKAQVPMLKLKATFERLGLGGVRTYINSGNVIFSTNLPSTGLASTIQHAIEDDFGFNVPVLVRNHAQMQKTTAAIQSNWKNDATMKCDVMFLWDKYNNNNVLNMLSIKPEVEEVLYVDGAIIWSVNRDHINQGQMLKIIGTDLYKHMTVRNCNTVRKLYALMSPA